MAELEELEGQEPEGPETESAPTPVAGRSSSVGMELGGGSRVMTAADPGILNHCESASCCTAVESVPGCCRWLQLSVAWLTW